MHSQQDGIRVGLHDAQRLRDHVPRVHDAALQQHRAPAGASAGQSRLGRRRQLTPRAEPDAARDRPSASATLATTSARSSLSIRTTTARTSRRSPPTSFRRSSRVRRRTARPMHMRNRNRTCILNGVGAKRRDLGLSPADVIAFVRPGLETGRRVYTYVDAFGKFENAPVRAGVGSPRALPCASSRFCPAHVGCRSAAATMCRRLVRTCSTRRPLWTR